MIARRLQTTRSVAVDLPYALWVPDAPPPWPVVLFLHGAGERGDDLSGVLNVGLPRLLQAGQTLPALVVAPQCPRRQVWTQHIPALHALLDAVEAEYPTDPARCYLTGLSMGGGGAWGLAGSAPERFAALAPICGNAIWVSGDLEEALEPLRTLPVWMFHGDADTAVPVELSRRIAAAFSAVGGSVQYTEYPEVGHNSWDAAYATPELYAWLFAQRRPDA